MHLLQSKLEIPYLPFEIKRKTVAKLLKDIASKKISTVIAGAGYGKTTLVAQAVRECEATAIWYSLDTSDFDVAVFLAYLARGFDTHFPGFSNLLRLLDQPLSDEFVCEKLVLKFLSAIEANVSVSVVVVLDDYHTIQASGYVRKAFETIIKRIAECVHFIIISRSEIDIRMSRYAAMAQVIEIREAELRFSIPEVQALFEALSGLRLSLNNSRILFEKTEGWAASLVLFHYTFRERNNTQITARLRRIRGSFDHIFNYLEENIFDIQTQDVKRFMMKTAFLPYMAPQFCDRLLKIDSSESILHMLEKNHLLTFSLEPDGRQYGYHQLLKDFLKLKCHREYTPREIHRIYYDIACIMEENNFFEMAIHNYLRGKWFRHALQCIERQWMGVLLEGKARFIYDAVNALLKRFKHHPELHYIKGKIVSLHGKPMQAIASFKRALGLYRQGGAAENVGKCMADIGYQYYFTGDIRTADRILKQLMAENIFPPPVYIQMMTFRVLFAGIFGKPDDADRLAEKALQNIAEYNEPERYMGINLIRLSHSYRYYVTGDFENALAILYKVLREFKRKKMIMSLPLTYFQISAVLFYIGNHKKGAAYARAGIAIADKNSIVDSQAAWLHCAMAQNRFGQKHIERAWRHARKSFDIFKSQGNKWGIASVCDLFCHLSMVSNASTASCRRYAQQGLEHIRGCGLNITEGILMMDLIECALKGNTVTETKNLFAAASKRLVVSKYHTFRLHLLQALVAKRRQANNLFYNHIKAAADIAQANHYDFVIMIQKEELLQCTRESAEEGHTFKTIRNLLQNPADRVNHHDELLPRKAADRHLIRFQTAIEITPVIDIFLLGKFRLIKAGRAVSSRIWKNSKALMLLKYLAAHRNQGFISKDLLMEVLWPEGDPLKTNKRFNVAFSFLRKALEPEIARGQSSSYIHRRKDGYCLAGDEVCRVDVDAFIRTIEAAENQQHPPDTFILEYMKAERLYKGPFLNEDRYAEWCTELREVLIGKYKTVLAKLIVHYEKQNDITTCIHYSDKYLSVDPYAEEMYRKKMVYHYQDGDRACLFKTWQKCQKYIVDELECPLSDVTCTLFNRLMQA